MIPTSESSIDALTTTIIFGCSDVRQDTGLLLLKRKKGFLNFEFTNNGQTLIGTFHDTDDPKIMDKFVVSKDIKGEKSFSNKNPVQYGNNNYYFTSYHEKTGISHNKNNQLF